MFYRSLIFKLTASFIIIFLVVVGIVATVAYQAAKEEFSSYTSKENKEKLENLSLFLSSYHNDQGGWNGVEDFFITSRQPMMQRGMMPRGMMNPILISGLSGFRVVLADAEGSVIADTGSNKNSKLSKEELNKGVPIYSVGNKVIGFLLIGSENIEAQREFVSKINKSLVSASVIAFLLAIVFGVFLSKKIASPISKISEASMEIASGNLNKQVVASEFSSEIKSLGESFNNMAQELKNSEELRRKLLADIAHELKTPLSVMQGTIEAMIDDVYPMSKERLSLLNEKGKVILRLINDLKTLDLAEAGKLKINLSEVDIIKILESVRDTFEVSAMQKHNSITVENSSELSKVYADEGRIFQVLSNLVSNANEYTENGQIKLFAQYIKGDNNVRISVSDTGVGISEDDIPMIFDRFWRAETSRSREYGGSGLGLSIVKEVIELHGERIWVDSEPGKGTTITFTLKTA